MILLAASIIGLVAVPLALWLLVTLFGLLGRILGFRLRVPGVVLLVVVLGGLVAGSLTIDRTGVERSAQVIDKKESVVVHSDGGWADDRTLTARYSPTGDPIPSFTSTSAALLDAMDSRTTVELAVLRLDVAEFDRLKPGDSLDVRILRVGTLLSIVRPASQTTETLIPKSVVEDALAGVAVLCLAWRLRKTTVGYALIAGLVVVALATPLALAYQNWRANEGPDGATERATATIGPVTRVTQIEIGDEREGTEEVELSQPYDVVALAFHPPNYPDAIVAVDAVDAHEATRLATGASVEVVFPPGNPRAARLPGQTRTHYLKTTLAVYEHFAIYVGLLVVLAIIGGLISRAWRAWYPRNRIVAALEKSAELTKSAEEWRGREERP